MVLTIIIYDNFETLNTSSISYGSLMSSICLNIQYEVRKLFDPSKCPAMAMRLLLITQLGHNSITPVFFNITNEVTVPQAIDISVSQTVANIHLSCSISAAFFGI